MKYGIRNTDLLAIRIISNLYFAFHAVVPNKAANWLSDRCKKSLAVFIAAPPELPEEYCELTSSRGYKLPLPEQMIVLVDQAEIRGIVFAVSGDNDPQSYFSILPNNRGFLNRFSQRKWNVVCNILSSRIAPMKPKLGDKVVVRGTFGVDWKTGLTHINPIHGYQYY